MPVIAVGFLPSRLSRDTEIVPLDQRLGALQQLRERILGQNSAPLNFGELARQQGSPAEKLLLEKTGDSLAALNNFSAADQKLIRDVLATITGGQELDLRRFGRWGEPPGEPARGNARPATNVIALETDAELDDYTWRVAGCVGGFWTKICRAHLFPNARLDEQQFIADGIRFGKGLQLVNILRDLPADLKNGRCYLPLEKLEPAHLLPETLLSPANEAKFLKLYRKYLDQAESHLRAGWIYTNTIPFSQFRVRLACAWPILIGMKTIERLRAAGVIELRQHLKISHGERNVIIWRSVLASPLPFAWRRLFPAGGKAVASGGELA